MKTAIHIAVYPACVKVTLLPEYNSHNIWSPLWSAAARRRFGLDHA